MLKQADELYKKQWQRCYDVGQLLEMRGHSVDGIKIHYHDRGDWDYYIVVNEIRIYDFECQSRQEDAETIKDVVVRIENKIKGDGMTWDYRIVRNQGYLSIHEAYYGNSETPHSITENAVRLGGETLEELLADLEHMKTALQKPILDYKAFEKKNV